jgi:hypothetical protein
LHGFGFQPGHLFGLDKHRIFNDQRVVEKLRDGYYLWCFDTDITNDCIYLPNLWGGDIMQGNDQGTPYYNDAEFQLWLTNTEDYAAEARSYLIKISKEMGQTPALTLAPGLTWASFETNYWRSVDYTTGAANPTAESLFGRLSVDTFKSINNADMVLFPNRRCWDYDYTSMTDHTVLNDDQVPPFCNVVDYPIKPRTNRISSGTETVPNFSNNSLFPMETRTRVEALARSNSAYFISIIVVQWADLMICKTRIRSLFEQGMTNTFMNYSLFFETILGAFLVYVPVANTVCGTRPLRFSWWTAGVPFSLAIYMYDEFRKGWIRKNDKGWIHRNTYW